MFRKKFLYVFVVVSMVFNLVPWDFANMATAPWGTAALIESDNAGDASLSDIAYGPNGTAMAVWKQSNGMVFGVSKYSIYASKYNGTTWSAPTILESDQSGDASSPKVAMDATGTAIAVWYQNDGTRDNIYANKYNGTSWGGAALLEADNSGAAYNPRVAMDGSGNAFAVWFQSDGVNFNTWANKYNGTSWVGAELIEADDSGNVGNPKVAVNSGGNAIAVWTQNDGTRDNIYANKYNGTSWVGATLIETNNDGAASIPEVAIDTNGNAIAVWQQSDGVRTNIWANKYNGTSWVGAALIETDDTASAQAPQIAFDGSGNAIAVWHQSNGVRNNIYANKYNGTSWAGAEVIQETLSENAYTANIDMDSTGNAIAVWEEYDGTTSNIWSNTYTGNTPPTLTTLTATPATDATGEVTISAIADDADNNSLSLSYRYSSGACAAYDGSQATTTLASSISASYGSSDVTVDNSESTGYQLTSVTTTPGANIVTTTWNSATDASEADGDTYCLYAYAYDGTVTSTVATTTVTLDNTAPSAPSITGFTIASTTLTPAWSTATGASTYTVSSTVESAVTTSSLNYPFTSLTPNTVYSFQLKATDSYGNATSYSTATSTYTNPAQPLSVSAVASGPSAVQVSWTANGNPTSTLYKVYNASKGIIIGTTTGTTYMDTGVSSASSYYYTVRAVYASDSTSYVESAASAIVATPSQATNVSMTVSTATAGVEIPFSFSDSAESHTVTLNSISNGVASITIQSTPVTVSLGGGQSQNIDTDGNGHNDMTVTMVSVGSSDASFTLTSISTAGGVLSSPPTVDTTTNENQRAMLINEGTETTTTRDVRLSFHVTGSTLMAISNKAAFDDASFESYTDSKPWTLTEGNGTKVVYAKFRSSRGGTIIYSDTITLTGQSFDDPDALKINNTPSDTTENTDTSCPLTPDYAYKTLNSRGVYYITTACTKRPFKNSSTYFTYFPTWNNVRITTEATLNTVPNDTLNFMPAGPLYDPQYGALVKTVTDPKVYLLLNEKKYWITDEDVFNTLKYQWTWIEDIDQRLLNKYTIAEEITDKTTHPQYTLIKYTNNAKVYRLEPNPTNSTLTIKRHIANEAIFKALGFRDDRIVTVSDTEVYTDGDVLDAVE